MMSLFFVEAKDMHTTVDLSVISDTNSFKDVEAPEVLPVKDDQADYLLLNETTPELQREIDFLDAI
ncbi:hypothetical protein H6F86_23275 [Phormidium sp. FACHB-592]|uniref:Uncharacterized protein n=1 Tax=Stenomitos frigidus AS-A4 TaxID=2933935 RepID=A0ABV0KRB0_9CYAN|nr:hypothetical protein [Phormidium sp. FACHB-592]MBD2076753.1 hypothetical protein [Phormidium sp. FACHB-592]